MKNVVSITQGGKHMSVKRVFVEKKPAFAVQAMELRSEIESYLGIHSVTGVRVLIRYDIENISDETYNQALATIFSEPPVDDVFEGTFPKGEQDTVFSVEHSRARRRQHRSLH